MVKVIPKRFESEPPTTTVFNPDTGITSWDVYEATIVGKQICGEGCTLVGDEQTDAVVLSCFAKQFESRRAARRQETTCQEAQVAAKGDLDAVLARERY